FFENGNLLRLAILQQLKVLFLHPGKMRSALVDDDRHHDQFGGGLDFRTRGWILRDGLDRRENNGRRSEQQKPAEFVHAQASTVGYSIRLVPVFDVTVFERDTHGQSISWESQRFAS